MPITSCSCCSFYTGAPSRSEDGIQLHHAFCPAWTMVDNYIYPGSNLNYDGGSDPSPSYRYTFTPSPSPTIFYVLHFNNLKLFLDFSRIYHLSAAVRSELTHESIPPTEYFIYQHTTPSHRKLIRTFAPDLPPIDLGAFKWQVVQAFILFVHGSPMLATERCELRTERQWLQLGALAQMFHMRGLFDYAAEGLSGAVERQCRKRKRSSAVREVMGRLRRLVERDPWMGVEDELCSA